MAKRQSKPKTDESLKENEGVKVANKVAVSDDVPPVEDTTKSPPKKKSRNSFFAEASLNGGIDGFIKEMKVPREKIDAPEITFGDDDLLDLPKDEDAILDQVEDGTLSFFDYDEDHERTAEFGWVGLDFLVSTMAGIYAGEDAEKYARFNDKKKPTKYQVSVAAAVVKKYQTKLSLEWMLATIVFMAFTPAFAQATKDRKANRKKAIIEEEKTKAEAVAKKYGNT